MVPSLKFRSLPVTERLQLVADIWDSIAEDQHALPDHPGVVKELRERKARYVRHPDSGIPWETAKENFRSRRS